MLNELMAGLSLLTPEVLMWIGISVVIGTVLSIIPGLGGLVGMAIMLPIAVKLGPEIALAMLVPLLAVSGTGNIITSVIFGVPGTAQGVATIFDGHPMARAGMAIRAITAGATASAVGGVLGALALVVLLPLMRAVVLAVGIPEFFALVAIALLMLAFLTGKNIVKGLSAGLMGVLLSYVGLDASTGTGRYTFDIMFLRDSIPLVPLFIGVFAIAEMMILLRKGGTVAQSTTHTGRHFSQVIQGITDVFKKWRATLISSGIGLWFGIVPGVGGTAAQFAAYTSCMNVSKVRDNYGKGEVEGVIASDAATNSVDSGNLVPTLALGIPGSAGMALLLVAMQSMGIAPGEELMTTGLDLIWLIVIVLVLSNILASILTVSLAPTFAKLTNVPASAFAAPIIVICLYGAYASSGHVGGIITAIVGGLLGYVMQKYGYSRTTLVIGFVLGSLMEHYLLLSIRIFGPEFLLRPGVLGIFVVGVAVVVFPSVRKAFRKEKQGVLS